MKQLPRHPSTQRRAKVATVTSRRMAAELLRQRERVQQLETKLREVDDRVKALEDTRG